VNEGEMGLYKVAVVTVAVCGLSSLHPQDVRQIFLTSLL